MAFSELKPPENLGNIRAIDVAKTMQEKDLSLEEYTKLAEQWAQSAWDAWTEHHKTVRRWYDKYN